MSSPEDTKSSSARVNELTKTVGSSAEKDDSITEIEIKKVKEELSGSDNDLIVEETQEDPPRDELEIKEQSTAIADSFKEDSSLKLVIENTPEKIAKIPESQDSNDGESTVETSQQSTVEIETTNSTADKERLSVDFGNEGNSHKISSRPSHDTRENIFGKSAQEEEHSLHISQEEIFGSHVGVVASTPQSSINPCVLSIKKNTPTNVANDDEMIPSSPDEKIKKSSVLSLGHGFVKREKISLSSKKLREELSSTSPDVVEIAISPVKILKDSTKEPEGKRKINFDEEDGRLESQETIFTETDDRLTADFTKTETTRKYKKISKDASATQESSERMMGSGDCDSESVGYDKPCHLVCDETNKNVEKHERCTDVSSGLKRKFERVLQEDEFILGRRNSSDEDIEVIEVKKSRKSVELLYAKPTVRSSQRFLSPSKPFSNSSSESTSSSSGSPSLKALTLKRPKSVPLTSSASRKKQSKSYSDLEEQTEEDFTLHMSLSEGQVEMGINSASTPQKDSPIKDSKTTNNCSAMSTIMEVDEGNQCSEESLLSGKGSVQNFPEKQVEEPSIEEADMDCGNVCERSSCEVLRPSSPEYLSGDDDEVKSWMALSRDNAAEVDIKERSDPETEKKNANTEGSNGEAPILSEDTNLKDDVTVEKTLQDAPEENKEKTMLIPSNANKAVIHRWFVLHVVQDVAVEDRQISSTRLLESHCFSDEIENIQPKEKILGRVSDISKTSSLDSKSSACLGDISSPPNPVSPQNTSGEPLFRNSEKMLPLPPPRSSIMSTFSHSSSSTSGSDLAITLSKGKEMSIFTKPYQPLSIEKEKCLIYANLSPDLKALKKIQLDASDLSLEISKYSLNISESNVRKIEQDLHEISLNSFCSKEIISNKLSDENGSKDFPHRRYLSRKPKGKKVSLRLRRKGSNSSKSSPMPVSSQDYTKNTEDQDTLPIEECLDEASSPNATKPENVLPPSSPVSTRAKEFKGGARRQKKSSENSSESVNGSRLISDVASSPVCGNKRMEIPTTPRSVSATPAAYASETLSEGTPVFARFSDKWYYPGKVMKHQKDDRWVINFDDGNVRSVREEFIVAVDALEQGQSVYAAMGDNDAEYEPGMITLVEMKKKIDFYTVALDIGITQVFPRSSLCLTEDQVNILKELKVEPVPSTPKRMADVSLDNVLEGKRSRGRKVVHSLGSRTPSASMPGTSKSHSGSRPAPPVLDSSSSMSTVSEVGDSATCFDNIPGLEQMDSPEPSTPDKGKGPGRRKGQRASSKKGSDVNKSLLGNTSDKGTGPIPSKGSSLFKEKLFILNYSANKESKKRKVRTRQTQTDTSSEGESCEEFSFTPFVKNHLKKQLEFGSGTVFYHYDSECRGKDCFLISNKCNLTADYVFALAADIQCVSHDWVIKCCSQGELLPWMENLLPAGWSLEEERYVEWHERSNKALKNVEIVLASDSGNNFLEFWRKVLVTAGANVRKVSSKTMSSQEDISYARVVVTDHMCPAGILDRAKETGIPMVSTVWVQQSLIHGKMRPFAGHAHYAYDYRHID